MVDTARQHLEYAARTAWRTRHDLIERKMPHRASAWVTPDVTQLCMAVAMLLSDSLDSVRDDLMIAVAGALTADDAAARLADMVLG